MTTISTVAVTGASGFVGRYMVRALLDAGYSVRALVRDREKARAVLPAAAGKLTLVVGDVTDARSVEDLVQGTQACVHLVGIIREVKRLGQTFQRMHVDATRVVVSACEKAGVKRYLQMSALGARDVGVAEYQHTKFEAEQIVRRSGLAWTIFRPSLIHGKDGEFVHQAQNWLKGEEQPYFFLPYFQGGALEQRVPLGDVNPRDPRIAPVAVEDVCAAFVRAFKHDATVGETYNLCGGDVMTWPQMLNFMKENTPGALPLQPFGIPSWIAALQAQAASLVGLGQFLPFDAGMAKMGGEDNVADMTKTRDELGMQFKGFKTTYAAYAGSGH
jgi:NADH dehydrogenase